jgi:UDP-glucose 4-epimerase
MRALVTGGFGFIGSCLVERLLGENGASVHVIDNLSTSPIQVDAFVGGKADGGRLTYDICTVQDYFSSEELPGFDEVYHLASVVGPVGVLQHGGRMLRGMVDDIYLLMSYCQRTGSRLCDISTSEVYGGGRDGYCSEKDSMVIPPKISVRLEYAVSKLACEVALMNTTRTSNLHATIVRPFNVAGPRQSPKGGFVLPRFILQALAGEPITVYGDGSMVRAFTHVKDIVDGIIRTMRCGRKGEAYNIGNPWNKTTILQLAENVIRTTGSQSRITFVDPKKLWGPLFEEANDKYPDADRATSQLGWKPQYSIPQIIEESTEYIRNGRVD